jgi:CubicO group peptidase (beta-lactamase class C family)
MPPLKPRSVTLFLALCCMLASSYPSIAGELQYAKPEDVGMSSAGLQAISKVMQQHIDAGDIQGAVTVVARRGKVVHFEAHGMLDEEKQIPMSRDAIFRMASSTKPVLGIATMMMIDEGLISAQDPVSKYIPEFRHMQVAVLKEPVDEDISPMYVRRDEAPEHRLVPAEREITIHHLLTHTSGLRSSGLGSAVAERQPRDPDDTLAQVIPRLAKVPLDFQPGTRWSYSAGTGLNVVSRIIEIASGMSFDQFLQKRIFDPIGMKDTHFNVPADKMNRRVVITGRDNAAWNSRPPTKYFSASGGLSSTGEDFLRFEQLLINNGTLFGQRILSPAAVKTMSTNQVGTLYNGLYRNESGVGFGYTVAVKLSDTKGSRSKGAFGWGGAYGTRSWTDPELQLTGVLMLQQSHNQTKDDFEVAVRAAIID